MFYNDAINKNKLNKVTTPVDLEEYPINPRDYDYAIDFAGNIQDAKGCVLTSDYTEILEIAGNNQNICSKYDALNTYQSDGHLEPSKKPLTFNHIKHTHQSDVLIIPFSFTISSIPTNRIYSLWGLFFEKILLECVDLWPVVKNDNKPLTIDGIKDISNNNHIQMTSKNDKKEINLIYAPTFDKQFHSLSMNNHSLPIIFNHFFMFRNDKFYLHILYMYIYHT